MKELDFTHIDFSSIDLEDCLNRDIFDPTKIKPIQKREKPYNLTQIILKDSPIIVSEGEFKFSKEKEILVPYVRHCSVLGLDTNSGLYITHITKGLNQEYFYEQLREQVKGKKIFSIGNITKPLLDTLNSLDIPYQDIRSSNKYSKDIVINPVKKEIDIIYSENKKLKYFY